MIGAHGTIRRNPAAAVRIRAILRFVLLAALTVAALLTVRWLRSEIVLAHVRNVTRSKIIESNTVDRRPGSVYDDITYFESVLGLRPHFYYEFRDVGLGTAEPLYPIYQPGYQRNWWQLFRAWMSNSNRHIDHFSSLVTPEGCRVRSMYLLRKITEFPSTLYQKEREEGYTEIVIMLHHYEQMHPAAECGRRRSHPPDPSFDPEAFFRRHLDARQLADFPPADLARFEAEVSAVFQFAEELDKPGWPPFDREQLKANSLWYYPAGFPEGYGLDTRHPQPGLPHLNLARHLVVLGSGELQQRFPLSRLVPAADFAALVRMLSGDPVPGFDREEEPGMDTFSLYDVTGANIYTSGLDREFIADAVSDVTDPTHYALVGMAIKPYDVAHDGPWERPTMMPQIRFVYQLMDPRRPGRPLEQLYIHLSFDVVDAMASEDVRSRQHHDFLRRVDELAEAHDQGPTDYEDLVGAFITDFTRRPVEEVAFSSSLTGIWIFGALVRNHDVHGSLAPLRIVRDGVDVGYYSSVYDNDLFHTTIATTDGERTIRLKRIMDDLTVDSYRDPKRMDVDALSFDRITCAQCHQMSGRDGVHMALNDGIDSRIKTFARPTEFVYREAERQLKLGEHLQLGVREGQVLARVTP